MDLISSPLELSMPGYTLQSGFQLCLNLFLNLLPTFFFYMHMFLKKATWTDYALLLSKQQYSSQRTIIFCAAGSLPAHTCPDMSTDQLPPLSRTQRSVLSIGNPTVKSRYIVPWLVWVN